MLKRFDKPDAEIAPFSGPLTPGPVLLAPLPAGESCLHPYLHNNFWRQIEVTSAYTIAPR